MRLDLSMLSAFRGFGMERSQLLRTSQPPREYQLPELSGFGTSWIVLGDGTWPASSPARRVRRVSRQLDRHQLVQLGSWCGSAQSALNELWSDQDTLVVDAEYLADLADPRPMLLAIKRRCLRTGEAFVGSAPARGTRQWCWSADEFERLLLLCGFELKREQSPSDRAFWRVQITPASHSSHLIASGIDPALASASQLLVTSEDATNVPTGGIGTYTKIRKRLDPQLPVLLCEFAAPPHGDRRTFRPCDLVGSITRESFVEGFGLVEAIRVLLLTLPQLHTVEFQDYQSLGFRLVQSKATGGLPDTLALRVLLHGGIDYVKFGIRNAAAADYSLQEAALAAKDSYILSNADEAVSPSSYLADLLQHEFGYTIGKLRTAPLPFPLDCLPPAEAADYGAIRRIAFIGKYNELKGWPDFIVAMRLLARSTALGAIEEICSIAPGAPAQGAVTHLDRLTRYAPLHFDHERLLRYISERRCDTLFVIPSRGENYPFVILEQVLLGSRFVAYGSGGLPEVIRDPDYVNRFCTAPTPDALAARIAEILQLQPREHGRLAQDLMHRSQVRQAATNGLWVRPAPLQGRPALRLPDPDVSIVVPVYNARADHLSELLASVRGSTVQPKEIIFVDDGSDGEHARSLDALVEHSASGVATRVVRQPNKGLAAARNRGLAEARTVFTYFLDSDDLLLPNTLQDAWIALSRDPELVIATGFGLYFADGSTLPNMPTLQRDGTFWKPLGIPEARSVSLAQNQYMAANAMVRTDALRQCGGWDESDRSMWEDWALFNRLAWSGHRFCLLPAAGFLYRNTPGSMSKTYSPYFARRRLVRNLPMMTRLDAATVLSLVATGGSVGSTVLPLTSYEAKLIGLLRKILSRPALRRAAIWAYRRISAARRQLITSAGARWRG